MFLRTGLATNISATRIIEMVLPKQLVNKNAYTGFVSDASGTKYYSTSGYQARNSFIQDENGNWYYFDKRGYLATGAHEIDGKQVYFPQEWYSATRHSP